MKLILLAITVLTLSGCSSINKLNAPKTIDTCLQPGLSEERENGCKLMPWVDYWLQAHTLNWKERQTLLSKLTNSPADNVKIILLSHVPGTPYQTRLRAQLAAQKFTKNNSGKLANFIHYIVFLHSQEKLELESALTTRNQFNQDQEQVIKALKDKITEQELQIKKLLQIEKNIVEKPIDNPS